jgi:16S rRNA C967 or C1407 C5-methylase (RsmB/RsmF family)
MSANFPPHFERRMSAALGERFNAFARAHQTAVPVSIRLNPFKQSQLEGEPVPWSATGRYLKERPSFVDDPHLHGGAYYVQEASSMFLEQAIRQCTDTTQPVRVLDLCAAPGGKSTHLVSLLHPESLIVSNEVIRSRAYILQESLQKWGRPNVIITNNDPSDFRKLNGYFDLIVVDAPCSGEGLFRKEPESMNEWSDESARLCSLRQRRILQAAWPSLKTGGSLVYCTCTYNPDENEKNLRWFADEEEFDFVSIPADPAWGVESIDYSGVKAVRMLPDRVRGEGFFLSVLRKTQGEEERTPRITKADRDHVKSLKSVAPDWIKDPERFLVARAGTLYSFFPRSWGPEPLALSASLNVIQTGTPLIEREGKKEVPSPAAALSTELDGHHLDQTDLDLESALLYLRRESVHPASPRKGLHLVRFEGTPLGWLNRLDNRSNNLWPKEWRIRKPLQGR